jgi:hypothetical protein
LQHAARSMELGGTTANCRRSRHRNTGCEEAARKAEVGGFEASWQPPAPNRRAAARDPPPPAFEMKRLHYDDRGVSASSCSQPTRCPVDQPPRPFRDLANSNCLSVYYCWPRVQTFLFLLETPRSALNNSSTSQCICQQCTRFQMEQRDSRSRTPKNLDVEISSINANPVFSSEPPDPSTTRPQMPYRMGKWAI